MGFLGINKVPQILSSGDIFLNTSISEAFCIAILEAASCGLYVCSTNVGGINEILPHDFLTLCEPQDENMIEKLNQIIENKLYLEKKNYNKLIKNYYNWHLIAKKTEKTYLSVLKNYERKNILSDYYIGLTDPWYWIAMFFVAW